MPPSRLRHVSAVEVRRRWASTSRSRPSSPDSNSTLPRRTSSAASRSTTRATAASSPRDVARCRAAAATVSAPAMANRAETPDRLVDRGGGAQRPGEPREDLDERVGDGRDEVGLLPDHGDLVVELARVVGADLGAEPVLQGGDDPAAVRVVLGVGAGDDEDVEEGRST